MYKFATFCRNIPAVAVDSRALGLTRSVATLSSCDSPPTISHSSVSHKYLTHAKQLATTHDPWLPSRENAKARISARDLEDPLPPLSPFLTDRCLYCMPLDGVPLTPNDKLLSSAEIERLSRLFVQQGVNKIRLTGGEPTIRKDLPEIISGLFNLKQLGLKQIGITTNGLTISRQLRHLVANGLTHLNVSLDTLDPFKFELMTRRPANGIHKVMNSIDMALALGIPQVKVNVVVVRNLNDGQDVLDFVEWTKDRNVVVRFIEYMPFDGNRWRPEKLVPYNTLLGNIQDRFGPLEKVSDDPNDTSKHWKVPGYAGSIGFITSMTEHFCGTCNRLRITADGNLKVCLFGNAEVSLRDAMRQGLHGSLSSGASDEELLHIVGAAVGRKHARHAGMADPIELAKALPRHRSTRKCGHVPFLKLPVGHNAPHMSTMQTRLFSDQSNGNQGPWEGLDSEVDIHIKSSRKLESHHNAAEQMASRGNAQSWSSYMGTESEGEDSPWASLDAFADSSSHKEPSTKAAPDPRSVFTWEAEAAAAAERYAAMALQETQANEAHTSSSSQGQPRLTHIHADDSRASMVNVSHKETTLRSAEATCRVYIPDDVLKLLEETAHQTSQLSSKKGPVLHTAQIAGIMAAKKTSELIPLCHGLNLSHVDVHLEVVSSPSAELKNMASHVEHAYETSSITDDAAHYNDKLGTSNEALKLGSDKLGSYILVRCTATVSSQTGVEMEALTGASVASLTLWDMLKSVGGKKMRIDGLMVTRKSGGKSGNFVREK